VSPSDKHTAEATILWGANNIFSAGRIDDFTADHTIECRIRGKRLKVDDDPYSPLAPGDRVVIDSDHTILQRLPRNNSFHRWNLKGQNLQTLAANLDQIVIMGAVGTPPFRPRFLDRALICAEYDSVPPIIAINKIDHGLDDQVEERLEVYRQLGIPVYLFSVKSEEGLDELLDVIGTKLTGFVGQSGVGKSSLLQKLFPGQPIKIGAVSEKHQRGRHTTTLARMYFRSMGTYQQGIKVIDTPGVRELGLQFIAPQELSFYFHDFDGLRDKCTYNGCTHDHEPGCKVIEAFESGQIHPDRYESYLRILQEIVFAQHRKYQ
jgi:ribosome biogenesis GTPase